MNENNAALVEKKFHKPGGCVGIFFQLFDWNRRLSKKKFFSKKLLSQAVRHRQASKKFPDSEKHPKLRLIVDNSVDLEMRVPGLVARLMGLESIPATASSNKVAASIAKTPENHGCSCNSPMEKRGVRPQKLQKTNASEKQQLTASIRQPENLPLMSALFKPRKHHHPKLPFPVKSPRNHSKKRASKLLATAATKILEPGLQRGTLKLHGNEKYHRVTPFCEHDQHYHASLQHKKHPNIVPKTFSIFNRGAPCANLGDLSSKKRSIADSSVTTDKFEMEKRFLSRGQAGVPLAQKRSSSYNVCKKSGSYAFTTDSLVKQERLLPKHSHTLHSYLKYTSWDSCNLNKYLKPVPRNGDGLGSLLEQKLKELNCEGKELGDNASKCTISAILQELIDALEISLQQDIPSCISYSTSSNSQQVGEAMDYDSKSSFPDLELLDSGASDDNPSRELVMNVLRNVSEILCHNTLASLGINRHRDEHTKSVLLNAELVFQSAALSSAILGRGSPIKHLLIDELETLATVLWMKVGSNIGIYDGAEAHKLKRFGFEAILEYLNSRFGMHTIDGSRLSKQLHFRMSTEALMFEVIDAAERWNEESHLSLNELIDREMSYSLQRWTRYETETYDYGLDVCKELLRNLVNEIVVDLCP